MTAMTRTQLSGSDLTKRVAQVRAGFVETLDERILDLEGLKAMVIKGQRRGEALQAIANQAHRIRGVAGTLGFESLGTLAGKVDEAYAEFCSAPSRSHEELVAFWRANSPALESMLDEMERLMDSAPPA